MSLTITVRQTRNHKASDVQYIASKTIILPDPLVSQFAVLSELGFGDASQMLIAISPTFWVSSGSGQGQEHLLEIVSLREVLSYDEEIGPILTVMELDDFWASSKWAKEEARLHKKQQRSARVAHLKRLFTHPTRVGNTGICSQATASHTPFATASWTVRGMT